MDETCSDVDLAETLIILAGVGAREAAARFVSDCRDCGNDALATMWQGVVAAIDSLQRGADVGGAVEAALLPDGALPFGETANASDHSHIWHAPHDVVALLPPMTYENGQMIWYHARTSLEALENCAA